MNVLAVHEKDSAHLVFFLRAKHRPDCFFAEGEDQYLVSPASVDMAGHIVTPREMDFLRLEAKRVADVYREVSAQKNIVADIRKRILPS